MGYAYTSPYGYVGYEYNYYLKKKIFGFKQWLCSLSYAHIITYLTTSLFGDVLVESCFFFFLLLFISHTILANSVRLILRNEFTESMHLKAEEGFKLRPVCFQVQGCMYCDWPPALTRERARALPETPGATLQG